MEEDAAGVTRRSNEVALEEELCCAALVCYLQRIPWLHLVLHDRAY